MRSGACSARSAGNSTTKRMTEWEFVWARGWFSEPVFCVRPRSNGKSLPRPRPSEDKERVHERGVLSDKVAGKPGNTGSGKESHHAPGGQRTPSCRPRAKVVHAEAVGRRRKGGKQSSPSGSYLCSADRHC